MKVRSILFWLHLAVGSIAGIIILVMCLTGIALAFERQINAYADRANRQSITAGATRLSVDQLLQSQAADVGKLSAITVAADPNEPVTLAFGRERTLFLNPYTGKIAGEGSHATRAFFGMMERWHRALGAELRSRGLGRPIADAANLLFLFLVVSGVVLWWPRKWTRNHWRAALLFRPKLRGRAAHWNRHNVVGIWSALPLFVIVLSGVIMSYTWANNLLYTLTGSVPPPPTSFGEGRTPRAGRSGAPRHHGSGETMETAIHWQALFDTAAKQAADWRTVTLRWTPNNMRSAVFQIDSGNGGQPQKRAQLTLNPATGAVQSWEPFASNTTGRRLRIWARFLHTGEAFGLPSQIIATLATAGGVFLVWTGLAMAWSRLRRAIAKKERPNIVIESDSLVTSD